MERIVAGFQLRSGRGTAVDAVQIEAFIDVILVRTRALALYRFHLEVHEPLPQQATPGRQTKIERIVAGFQLRSDRGTAVDAVQTNAFIDVITRFHNLAGIESI